jgi:hypothetical protein
MIKYETFIFKSYGFDENSKKLTLKYSLDNEVNFEEKYTFDFEFTNYNKEALESAIKRLFLVAGVSYYKTYLPEKIIIENFSISRKLAEFCENLYERGLGEFFYVNNLDPLTKIIFPFDSSKTEKTVEVKGEGFLCAVGGGKDSLVSIDMLKNTGSEITTWSLNHKQQLEPLVNRIGHKHFYVDREWDVKLSNKILLPDSFSGHVPISAIFASTGVIVAILTGKRDVVMSNERSADEPTLIYNGVEINHQYSKSTDFEKNFQNLLKNNYGNTIRYYSLLRPLSELNISKYFCENLLEKYIDVFSSCNSAFRHGETKIFWDKTCPKCAFIYLMFSNFTSAENLTKIFDENLIKKPELKNTFEELLGITKNKPLECVGEIGESRWAMDKQKELDPGLKELFKYDNSNTNKFFDISENLIPEDIFSQIY